MAANDQHTVRERFHDQLRRCMAIWRMEKTTRKETSLIMFSLCPMKWKAERMRFPKWLWRPNWNSCNRQHYTSYCPNDTWKWYSKLISRIWHEASIRGRRIAECPRRKHVDRKGPDPTECIYANTGAACYNGICQHEMKNYIAILLSANDNGTENRDFQHQGNEILIRMVQKPRMMTKVFPPSRPGASESYAWLLMWQRDLQRFAFTRMTRRNLWRWYWRRLEGRGDEEHPNWQREKPA